MTTRAKLVATTQGINGECPGELLAEAFGQCYQKEANLGVVVKNMRHASVLEHVSFTFQVECSRVTWEQLVRHRIASYTAQSHRYTDIEPGDCMPYVPTEISSMGEDVVQEWKDDLISTWETYNKWRRRGVTKQTARYQAPKGISIKARVTFNLRSLINLLSLRTDRGAQEEIQVLSRQMWDEVKDHLPAVLYAGIESEFFPWIRED